MGTIKVVIRVCLIFHYVYHSFTQRHISQEIRNDQSREMLVSIFPHILQYIFACNVLLVITLFRYCLNNSRETYLPFIVNHCWDSDIKLLSHCMFCTMLLANFNISLQIIIKQQHIIKIYKYNVSCCKPHKIKTKIFQLS